MAIVMTFSVSCCHIVIAVIHLFSELTFEKGRRP
jgi:hypothetical protein